MPNPPPIPPVIRALEKYRRQLDVKEAAALGRLIRNWQSSWARLSVLLENLTLQIGEEPMTAGQLVRMERYKSLMAQVATELNGLKVLTANEIQEAGKLGVNLGITHGTELISLTAIGNTSLTGAFNKLPVEATKTLLGFLDPEGALFARLNLLAPTAAGAVANAMTEGISLGLNPRVIASNVRQAFGRGLTDALRFVRTAQIWSYREANRASFLANDDILEGWVWVAALDDRTCPSCIALHGTIHPTLERLNDHHNGRCVAVPVVKGFENPITETGEQFFLNQSEQFQKSVLGKGAFEAWSGGAFQLSDMVTSYDDEVYGNMRSTASLKDLLGK